MLELIFYALNVTIAVDIFKAVDMGGSMLIHTFGAYFGLASSFVLTDHKKLKAAEEAKKTGSV